MAIGDPYVTLAELKTHLRITDTGDDDLLGDVITSVSRLIERHCGRQFNDAGSVSARVFWPTTSYQVCVDEFHTITGLIVATDRGNDGTYSTTLTDYNLYPLNGVRDGQTGWPYHTIQTHPGSMFASGTYRPGVQVTAQWGWATVPDDVKQACLIQCARIFGRRSSVHGVVGQGDFVFRVSNQVDPDVSQLLDRFVHKGMAA